MPLMPKRVKYRKSQRGNRKGFAQSGNTLEFGEYGLQALERVWLTAIQIEACRVAVNRNLKRKGKMWIRVFPDKPISKKPIEVRMGNGKGSVEFWVAPIQPGRMLYEIEGVDETTAREAFRLAAAKLSVQTQFVTRTVL